MPKKAKYNPEELIEIIKKYEVHDKDANRLKGPAQKCWFQIQNDFNNLISAKYIYTIVLNNRHNIASKIGINSQDPEATSKITEEKISSFQNEELSDESKTSKKGDLQELVNFNITLSPIEWNSIFDNEPTLYKRSDGKNIRRLYYVLKPYEWTTLINEHIFEQTKLTCRITFKRTKINPEGDVFLKIDGRCNFCESVFKGRLEKEPKENSRVIVQCTMEGLFYNCDTREKRRVIGRKKEVYLDKLSKQNMSAAYVQRLEAKQIMEYGDPEPSHLPSLNALRILKYKESKKNRLSDDPFLAISMMKETSPYNTIIRDIGSDRFYIHYWTAPEINSYRQYCNKTKFPAISIDATGGLIKKFNVLSGRQTGNLFLYQVSVMDYKSKSQFSVAHMISERHDNNSISYWLIEWVKSGIVTPKIVVVDQSLALMIAVVRAFTQYSSLNQYIDVCSSLLMNEPGTKVPSCLVRNDFNHIMHLISTWPELKSTTFRIKNFYMRSIGLLIVCTDFFDAKTLLENIFIVALHETDGYNSNSEPTACEIAKNYLKHRIATHTSEFESTFSDENKDSLIAQDDEPVTIIDDSNTTVFQEIRYIYDKCVESSRNESHMEGDRDNMQFSPAIAKRLFDFCKLIPIWSALMVPIFEYGNLTETSCTSESLFKDLKTIVFKHKTLPVRLDDFFEIHINSILGSMNILADKIKQDNEKSENSSTNYTSYATSAVGKLEQCINNDSNKILKLNMYADNSEIEEISDKKSNDTETSKRKSSNTLSDDNYIMENWKGLGYQIGKKKKRGTYLDKDPTVLYSNDASRTKSKIIGLLKNGNLAELRCVQIEYKSYCVTNTCPFDSVVQILFSSYVDSNLYAEWVNSNKKEIIFELIANGIRDGINAQTYKKRAYILKPIMSQYRQFNETPDGLIILDCACTAYYLLGKLFEKYPSLRTDSECLFCSHKENKSHVSLTANLPTNNLHFMQDILSHSYEEEQTCNVCNLAIQTTVTTGSHIFIELVYHQDIVDNRRSNFDATVVLKDIPKNINLFNETFGLRGLISFIPPQSKRMDAIGHYISYNWREADNNWERCDDLLGSIRHVRASTVVNCQFVVYTI